MDVKFELGGKEESLPLCAADMEDPCILGMNYFVSRRCEPDFHSMQMTVEGRRVPVKVADKDGLQVTARRNCTISPKVRNVATLPN